MAAIRISIGAAVDPSVAKSLSDVEARASKAFAKMRDAQGRFSKEQVASASAAAQQTAAGADKAANARIRAEQRVDAQIARLEAKAAADHQRATQKKTQADLHAYDQRLRAAKRAHDAEERDIMRVAAAAEKAEARKAMAATRAGQQERRAFGREFGHRAVSNMGQAARFGMGVAGQIARGAGVDLDIGAAVGRNVALEKSAIDLSNAGYSPSEGKARVDPARIQAEVKAAADANAFSRSETMGGLQAFVGKTGDLEQGMRLMRDLGALSKATGTDLGDMVDAAGDVSNALSDIKNPEEKFKRIQATMKAIAGQGKIGAVEIKDLASQMAKLGASATAFEGDAAENVALMGAFAQMSRSKGGSSSATQAATSVASMVNTFKTPARIAAFKKEGIDVMNDEGMIRNPQQLVMAALSKTGGDPERFKKMFANVQGARAVEGFATTYRQARGGAIKAGSTEEEADAAGLKAVAAEFKRLKEVAMGEGEIRESLTRALGSQDAKTQMFNNRMDDVAATMQAKLAPALEKAAPGLIKFAEAMASVVAWAANNPWTAVSVALAGSIAKAGLETVVANGIAALLKGAAGGGGGVGGTGKFGKGLALGVAAVAGFGLGTALDSADEAADKTAEAAQLKASIEARNAGHMLRMAKSPEASAAAQSEAEKAAAGLKSRMKGAGNATAMGEVAPDYISAGLSWLSTGSVGKSLGQQSQAEGDHDNFAKNAMDLIELKAEMARNTVAVAASADKIVTAITTNGGMGPGIDPTGRQPPPGPWR